MMLVAVALLTTIALWMTRQPALDRSYVALVRQPDRIMGTTATLVAVVPRGHEATGQSGLDAGEQALRRVETLMSTYLDASEVSILNRAAAGEVVRLSPAVREVLAASQRIWQASGGAFDVTCRPLLELWRRTGQLGRVPTEAELVNARDASSWTDLELLEAGVRKRLVSASVDLGGVAKGYGIDLAFNTMTSAGCVGVLVDVGGDLRLGGHDDRGLPWTVAVRDPFADRTFADLEVEKGAVCTSGSYRRFVEIENLRFSHIVDPRTGWPTKTAASVTVWGTDAMTADAWATALSVLGVDGLDHLPPGVEALLVKGNEEDCSVHATAEMERLLGGMPNPPCSP
jgi:thiamine biosynthesis lipoprotein